MPWRPESYAGRARQKAPAWGVLAAGILLLLLLLPGAGAAKELTSKYARVVYDDEQQLQLLNEELLLGRQMAHKLSERKILTVAEEVTAKVDILLEKVEAVLDMFPEKLQVEIRLFSSAEAAQTALLERYGQKVDFISFYSRKDNIVYLSARDAVLRVVAHEFGHVVVEHYFDRSPPVKMHEVMAQFAEITIAREN